jgi:eukaryotic-like serine/threonine-protein kinase
MTADPFQIVGTTIAGHYAVEGVVGEGGFSVVYRARHTLWNRPVAIKAFRVLDGLDAEARDTLLRSFVQEGAILAELSERTTAIVQARDTATFLAPSGDWVPYLVLEWLDGETLEAVLWQERQNHLAPRTTRQAAALLSPIAQALAIAHKKGICHRDLKPGNVFVLGDARGDDCRMKLLDFGVAAFFSDAWRTISDRHCLPGRACGFTPSYGAPEQFSEAYGVTGPWTDVFALGLIFVEIVTGKDPIGEGTPEELAAIACDPNRRPTPRTLGADVSDRVESVLARALAVYPAERWHTVGHFWRALREAIEAPIDDLPLPSSTVRPVAARRPVRIAPAAFVALAIGLAVSAASDHRVRVAAKAPPAVVAMSTR